MLKGKMKKIVNSAALLGITFVLIFSLFLSTFSTVLFEKNALAVAPAGIKDRLSTFMALYLMSDQGDNRDVCSYKEIISIEDVALNNFGYDTGYQSQAGYSIDGSQHNWGCQDILGSKSEIATLWVNATGNKDNQLSYLKAIGYKCSLKECKYPTAETAADRWGIDGTTAKRSDLLDKLIPLLQGGNPDLMSGITATKSGDKYTITPSDALKYYAWFTAFTSSKDQGGCNAQFVGTYRNGTETQKQLAMAGNNGQDTGFYVINAVLPDGSLDQGIYSGAKAGDEKSVINGVGTKSGGKANCHEIADALFESKTSKDNGWTDNPNFNNSNGSWAKAFNEIVKTGDQSAKDTTTGTVSGAAANGTYDECFINIPIIGWLMCGMLEIADKMYTWIQGVVGQLLLMEGVNTLSLSADGKAKNPDGTPNYSQNGIYQGWVAVKNISSVLILLVGLFMILSQIFSFEFMSAYTVKKVLPRLIIAAIAIQLSWEIMNTLIYLVNAIGAGVYSLLVSPFSTIVNRSSAGVMPLNEILGMTGKVESVKNGAIFAFILGTGAAIGAAGGFIGMALGAIGVIITCFIVYFTLIIRYILIIVLLILSPVALVMWVLPGTQSIWKNWWSNFSKLLFMYPLIMVLFAAGAIGAYVINFSNIDLHQFAAIIAYFGPLFLIPATFKYAGPAMAAAGGGISKLGGMVKEKNPASKSLGKAAQVRQGLKDNNARINAVSGRGLKKYRGKFSTGSYGADRLPGMSKIREDNNQARQMYQYAEQSEAMKLQMQALDMKTHGMDPGKKKNIFLEQAKNKNLGETAQRAATAKLVEMQATPQLRELSEHLKANGQSELFETIKGENYSNMSSIAPDLVGNKFEDLSAEAMTTMKPETWNVMQDQMSTLDSQSRDTSLTAADRAAAASKLSSVRNELNVLQSTPAFIGKLSPESKNALMEIYTAPPGSPIPASGKNKYGA